MRIKEEVFKMSQKKAVTGLPLAGVTVAPPSASILTFGGIEVSDDDTAEDHDIESEAVLVLSYDTPFKVTVNGVGLGGHSPVAVWSAEPVGTFLQRCHENSLQKLSRYNNSQDGPWRMLPPGPHDRDYVPTPVNKKASVEESGLEDGWTLMPESQLEYWLKEHKLKHMSVGTRVLYYGDICEVIAVGRTTEAYSDNITVRHNGQEKRTLMRFNRSVGKQGVLLDTDTHTYSHCTIVYSDLSKVRNPLHEGFRASLAKCSGAGSGEF